MHEYRLIKNEKISPSTELITLKRIDEERPLSFQPGQYASLHYLKRNKRSVSRCFSIVSSPLEQDFLQFSMRIRGKFTKKISELNEGTLINIYGPFGGFIYNNLTDKEALFIAGGIGITPFISMLRYIDKINSSNKIKLIYSVANQDDIPFLDELTKIENKHPNIQIIYVVGSSETNKLKDLNTKPGFVTSDLINQLTNKDYSNKKFFICGPPNFIKIVFNILVSNNANKKNILTEAYTQSSPRQSSILRSWPANVYALGIISLILGSLIILVNDLLRILPSKTNQAPTQNKNFYLTNARQKDLDALVNSIPASPEVITSPTTNQQSSVPTVNTPPPTFSPIYLSPSAPKTTSSIPPP